MDLYDIFQNFKIGRVRDEADQTAVRTRGHASEIARLQDQVDHLSLVCQAMCEMMEEIGFNKQMMLAKIEEIDLRDGKLDGRLSKQHTCKGCNRPMAPRHIKCMYCGEAVDKASLL